MAILILLFINSGATNILQAMNDRKSFFVQADCQGSRHFLATSAANRGNQNPGSRMASSGVVRSGDMPNTCVKYGCRVCSINSERRNVPARPMHGTPAWWHL